jgi:hypothetical protein
VEAAQWLSVHHPVVGQPRNDHAKQKKPVWLRGAQQTCPPRQECSRFTCNHNTDSIPMAILCQKRINSKWFLLSYKCRAFLDLVGNLAVNRKPLVHQSSSLLDRLVSDLSLSFRCILTVRDYIWAVSLETISAALIFSQASSIQLWRDCSYIFPSWLHS